MLMFHAVLQTFSPTNIQSLDLCYRSLFQMSGSGPGAGAASVPTFQLSDQDQEERRPTQSQPSANNLLSVPTQIKYECSYQLYTYFICHHLMLNPPQVKHRSEQPP